MHCTRTRGSGTRLLTGLIALGLVAGATGMMVDGAGDAEAVRAVVVTADAPADSLGPQESARRMLQPWCQDVPIRSTGGVRGQAGYTVRVYTALGWPREIDEHISIGTARQPDHPETRAVLLHECAHILQYRAYGHDLDTLTESMQRIYPTVGSDPVEHMADCMSDLMGAQRRGSATHAHHAVGYGGECSDEQYAAAERLLSGHRL